MQELELAQITQKIKSIRFIIIDQFVYSQYRQLNFNENEQNIFKLEFPEESKNFEVYQKAIEFFLARGVTRADKIAVIGGGATSDFGGFVASTILRGISWDVYPTTLLAMVDASIGGKVGINTKQGKNLVGNFHEPENIYFCHEFLSTLPKEEYISGLGEVIKYCFLSRKIYDLYLDNQNLFLIILECANYKTKVVSDDLKEKGHRILLNLGHTFGHAIEKCLGIPHGLAVMFGVKLIVEIYSPHLLKDLNLLYGNIGNLNMDIPLVDFEKFKNYLLSDKKKTSHNKINLIIPREIGNVEVMAKPVTEVLEDLKDYKNYENYFK